MGDSKYKKSTQVDYLTPSGRENGFTSASVCEKREYPAGSLVGYNELSDLDFIRNIDRLSAPYYADYMQGRGQDTGGIDSFLSNTSTEECKGVVYPKAPPREVKFTGYFYRRTALLGVILLFTMLQFLHVMLSFFVRDMAIASLFDKVAFSDPILATFGADVAAFSGVENRLPIYFMGVFLIAYTLFTVVAFAHAIRAIAAKRRRSGVYKKFTFVLPQAVCFISMLLVMVCAWIMHAAAASDLPSSEPFTIGPISFLLLIYPVVSFVCGLFVYKNDTVVVPETMIGDNGRLLTDAGFEQFLKKNR